MDSILKGEMRDQRGSNLTLRLLDGDIELPTPQSPIEDWYIRVRDIPLIDLTDADIARACRQKIYLDVLVPICIKRIEVHPMAGDMYEGELVASLKYLPFTYWAAHPDQKESYLSIAEKAFAETSANEVHTTQRDQEGSNVFGGNPMKTEVANEGKAQPIKTILCDLLRKSSDRPHVREILDALSTDYTEGNGLETVRESVIETLASKEEFSAKTGSPIATLAELRSRFETAETDRVVLACRIKGNLMVIVTNQALDELTSILSYPLMDSATVGPS